MDNYLVWTLLGIVLFGFVSGFIASYMLRRIIQPADSLPTARTIAPELPQDAEARIKDLVQQGRLIDAIKQLREATGLGLKESKDMVERLRNGQNCDIRSLIEQQRSKP